MKALRVLASIAAAAGAAAVAGCGVVSDAPLFSAEVAPAHPLAEGLWAMAGPGCEAPPNPAGEMPECALPVVITRSKMSWDGPGFVMRTLGPAGEALARFPIPKETDYVLVDGDPDIIEALNGPSNNLPPPGVPGMGQLKPSYLALKVLQLDGQGRVVRGIIWPVFCPPPGRELPPGMSRLGTRCVVTTAAVVRSQAKSPGAAQSFFLSWVSARTDFPPAPGARSPP